MNGIAVGAGLSSLGTTAAADARIALAVAARWSIRSERDGMSMSYNALLVHFGCAQPQLGVGLVVVVVTAAKNVQGRGCLIQGLWLVDMSPVPYRHASSRWPTPVSKPRSR